MKRFSIILGLIAMGALLVGCESTRDSVREKFSAREQPRTRVFAAEPRATYEAARRAAEQMGYRYIRGGPAQGELEAMSGVSSNDTMSSSRQISMNVRLEPSLEGGTEVSLRLKEITEGDSVDRAGQATSTTLRDTPQYEVFFRNVQQALDGGKK
jgi:hypothetical protein